MKLFVKVLLALCVVAVAAPFVLKGPDGGPLMRLGDLRAPDVGLPNLLGTDSGEGSLVPGSATLGDAAPADGLRMYRWRDADGSVHFASEVPDGVQAEVIVVRDNITRLGADWVPEAPAAAAPELELNNPLDAYRNADKVIDRAVDAARLMEQHNANIDAVAGQL